MYCVCDCIDQARMWMLLCVACRKVASVCFSPCLPSTRNNTRFRDARERGLGPRLGLGLVNATGLGLAPRLAPGLGLELGRELAVGPGLVGAVDVPCKYARVTSRQRSVSARVGSR